MKELLKNATIDDAAIIVMGAATILQLLNVKVPRIIGVTGTAITLISMLKTVKALKDESKILQQDSAEIKTDNRARTLEQILS